MRKFLPNVFFLFVLIIFYWLLHFNEVIFKRPESVHVWAQCDRASVARNYAEESMNFFMPRTNFTQGGTGITGLEFPFMNYFAAICYKLFGFNEFWYRLLILITITAGLLAAFSLASVFLKNKLLAGLIVLAFFLSPVLNYYCANFLPDTASLGFILLSWFFFFHFQQNPKTVNLILFFVFGALASLIKITSLISIITILILLIMDKLQWLHSERRKVFSRHGTFVISIFIIFILVIAWYAYAGSLSKVNHNNVFLMAPRFPQSLEHIKYVWHGIYDTWVSFYYHKTIYFLILITGISLIVFSKKANRMLGVIILSLWIGNMCFIVIMFGQFMQHDYYIIPLLPAVLFQFIAAFEMYFRIIEKKYVLIAINLLMVAVVTVSVFYSGEHQRLRYDKGYWLYSGREYSEYYRIELYLRKLGITHEAKVISMYDVSFNITLYLMNVKGWRIYNKDSDDEVLKYAAAGAEYLVVNDDQALTDEKLKPFFKNKIGEFVHIKIYKLKN